MRVGFIGLGGQGLPMAQRIEQAGWPLTVWARRPRSLEPFQGSQARTAASPAELARASDVVGVCVLADADVLEVVLGADGLAGGLARGSVVLIHSTVRPQTCEAVAEALAPRGVGVLDMPVSGGARAALAGSLTVMGGGDAALFERVRPVCESYGQAFHLGPLGAGQRMKILNNTLFMANLGLAFAAEHEARAFGLDLRVMREVIQRSSGASYGMDMAARIASGQLPNLGHTRLTLAKDLGLFRTLAAGPDGAQALSATAEAALEQLSSMEKEAGER